MTPAHNLAICHHRAVSGSSEAPLVASSKVNADEADRDRRDISPVWNAVAFRRSFPDRWSQYLLQTYKTAYAVEKAFGVDSKTARDWIGGKRDPSGSFVAAVVMSDPKAIETLAPKSLPAD